MEYTATTPTTNHRRPHILLWSMILLLCGALVLHHGVMTATASATRAGGVWRGTIPGYDLGLDVDPPTAAQYGTVTLWLYPHDAGDYMPVLRLFGAPPRHTTPRPYPRPHTPPAHSTSPVQI